MIEISDFKCDLNDEAQVIKSCQVSIDGEIQRLKFVISKMSAPETAAELPIAASLFAMLIPAMERQEPLHIHASVDRVLLHRVNHYVVPILHAANANFKTIAVTAEGTHEATSRLAPKGALTGMSCGVDSMDTFVRYSRDETPENFKVTSLAVFDVGSFGEASFDNSNELKKHAIGKAKTIAEKADKHFFLVESNMRDFYKTGFGYCVSMLNTACANALSEYADVYLGASSVYYELITMTTKYPRGLDAIDAILYPMVSHPNMEVISSSAGTPRLEKILYILNNAPYIADIDVCTRPLFKRKDVRNCGTCHKCGQILMIAEAEGVLDRVTDSFDMAEHRRRHWRVCQRLITMSTATSETQSAHMVVQYLRAKNFKFASGSVFVGSLIGYLSRVIPFLNIKQIT